MHKRLSSVIAILLVLLSITACQDKAVDMTSAIPLSVSVSDPEDVKLITYDGSVSGVSGDIETVEISVYEGSSATGTPEATGTLSLSGGSASAVITNVIPGLYTITADGYSGTHQLTHDSITKRIIPSSSDVSIVLSTFQTTDPVGTITITPSFSGDDIQSAINGGSSFTASWTLYGGDALDVETAAGTASISSTPFTLTPTTGSIAPGRYILKATVTSDGRSYYAVSALRLLPGLPASGDLVFGLDGGAGEAGGESLTLVVTDSTGAVIPMTDGGIVSDDDTYTLSISGLTKEPQSVIVYANGERLTPTAMSYSSGVEKVELTITESAIYDILVVVLDGTASGVGSLHFEMTVNKPTFTVVETIVNGTGEGGEELYTATTDFKEAERFTLRYYPSPESVSEVNQTKAPSKASDYYINYTGSSVYRVVRLADHTELTGSISGSDLGWQVEEGMYINPNTKFIVWRGANDWAALSGYLEIEVEKVAVLDEPKLDFVYSSGSLSYIDTFYAHNTSINMVDGKSYTPVIHLWDKSDPQNIIDENGGAVYPAIGTKAKAPEIDSGHTSMSFPANSDCVLCYQSEIEALGLVSDVYESFFQNSK